MTNYKFYTTGLMSVLFMFPMLYFNQYGTDYAQKDETGRFINPITVAQREYNGKQLSGFMDRSRGYRIQAKIAKMIELNNCQNKQVHRSIHGIKVKCLD